MTEKRFIGHFQGDMLVSVKDTLQNKNVNILEIIDIANKLNEENEQLKQQRDGFLNDLDKLEIAIQKVQKEFQVNPEVQRAIARIIVIKRNLKR